jgi:hypothetical protein
LKHLPGLEGNLADWPNGKKDYADAAAMALTLLGETQILAADPDFLVAPEFEALPDVVPPIYTTEGRYILAGSSKQSFKQRYG